MICGECGKAVKPEIRKISEKWEIRDDEIAVSGEASFCPECGVMFLDVLYDALLARAYDKYRQRYDLLTPKEISSIRRRWGLDQKTFADLIGVNVLSLRRYESGGLQPRNIDARIRSTVLPGGLARLARKRLDNRLSPEAAEKVLTLASGAGDPRSKTQIEL